MESINEIINLFKTRLKNMILFEINNVYNYYFSSSITDLQMKDV